MILDGSPLEGTPTTFDKENFYKVCALLGEQDADLKSVLHDFSYPPIWTRENSFESLVHIILEQQVSLASALAALNKLKEKTDNLSPEAILKLNDDELRACYVSRQKAIYIRGLATALVNGDIDLNKYPQMTNDEIRESLIRLKGIGNWTIDVYLMFSLQRIDLFPIGDLAVVNAFKRLKNLPASTTKEELLIIAESWKPFRTVASMILWHFYLSRTGKKIAPVE